ncbi:MAG: ABC transporter ATP-binding protein [Deltaproteobacteria bacterium]|nr:ABC transporter ATP-binding protein [Deltaproteobacteria bacterium]MBW2395130.1 ABC transporter ATP-binding protein [Deltaproteobacteria bacterium]
MPGEEPGALAPGSFSSFWRLLAYVRPYVGLMLIAVLAALVYSGARTGRALLIQPLFDDVILPQASAGSAPALGDWFSSALGTEGATPLEAPAETEARLSDDDAVVSKVKETLPRILLAALLILTLLPISHFFQVYIAETVLGRVLVDVQRDLCAKLLRLPLRFHQGVSRGDTLSRVMNDAQRAQQSLDLLFSDVVQSVLALSVGIATLLYLSWPLTLTLVVIAPPIAGAIAIFGRRIRKSARRRQESQAEVTGRLVQILAGIKVIKAFRAEAGEERAFDEHNLRFYRRNLKVVKNRALSRAVVEAITNAAGIAVLLLGVAVVAGQLWGLTVGSLMAFIVVMQTTYRPMKEITKGWTKLQEAMPSAERFFELLDTEGEPADAPDAVLLPALKQGISISNLSFSYGREPVLKDLSLEVTRGEVVAIVGPTGSGKTTLADLILRFYDPDQGRIEVDGIDLRNLARSSWQSRCAVVSQDPFLFTGSIRENIRYGRPDASDDEVLTAARAAHVDEFVSELPEGYETDVGDAGVRLSGGQRQRITIARAILCDPDVLIFDEATSSLDAKSERYVQEAIETLLGGRTVFIIAHRLSTVRHADKILVLEGGKVADVGKHDELMARGGLYRELMTLQGSPG